MVQSHEAKGTDYLLPLKTQFGFLVDGKRLPSLHTPFCFGCHDFVNSSTAKRNATFTVHTYIHMYATLLNNELMNKTIKTGQKWTFSGQIFFSDTFKLANKFVQFTAWQKRCTASFDISKKILPKKYLPNTCSPAITSHYSILRSPALGSLFWDTQVSDEGFQNREISVWYLIIGSWEFGISE